MPETIIIIKAGAKLTQIQIKLGLDKNKDYTLLTMEHLDTALQASSGRP